MRLISIAARPMPSCPCGGGGGVSYRLMRANEKHRLFEDTVFIFNDKCVSASIGVIDISSAEPVEHPEQLIYLYNQLSEIFSFKESDFFVFHDVESFHSMKESFPWIRKTLVVYHQQGSLYSEHLFFGNEPNDDYEKLCFEVTKYAIEKAGLFAFPSRGAKQALLETLPEIKPYLEKTREVILYNGCSPSVSHENSVMDGLLEMIDKVKGEIFVTVAKLNGAKGVELLPAFFREYGRYVEDYFWIVIGDGPKRGELSKGISDLDGHVLWLDGWVDNSDIIKLYERADYYILSHRFSIFDYSTIEAMHMGCVPILTPVGGNLEMITEENGYFLDEGMSGKEFVNWRKNQDIANLKEKNIRIAKEHFSEWSMLKAYYDLIMEQYD